VEAGAPPSTELDVVVVVVVVMVVVVVVVGDCESTWELLTTYFSILNY
jgi:hypothetical protein